MICHIDYDTVWLILLRKLSLQLFEAARRDDYITIRQLVQGQVKNLDYRRLNAMESCF